MGGDVEMHDPPAVVSQNQEHVQDLKPNRWHSEEVDRHHGLDVILQEGAPVLRRRLPTAYDVLAHAGLADIYAEFKQFAVDAGRAPKRILAAHLPNQLANLFRYRLGARVGRDELYVQNSWKPLRCQPMTVSGLTMTREDRQSIQTSHNHAHRSRSADVSLGRFTERRRTPSWCRSARFSSWSVARDLKAADAAVANM